MKDIIPFHRTARGHKEEEYVATALAGANLSSDGYFSKKCEKWLEEKAGCKKVFLTPSASSALELAAIVSGIEAGNEFIVPSFTFPSTANAFIQRGAVPVFIDVREDNLCMDEDLIRGAITEKTKAIVPVHYGGFAANMEKICAIAHEHGLIVIEDAAQSLLSTYKGKHPGTFGAMSCLSFHDTKNIGCGEGGALLINDSRLIEKAEILRNFGTNRAKFLRGEIDSYHWMAPGSSFMQGELAAACLMARLEEAHIITEKRVKAWEYYFSKLKKAEEKGFFRIVHNFIDSVYNGHIFALILKKNEQQSQLINFLKEKAVEAKSHYIPLHETPYGKKTSRVESSLKVTEKAGSSLVRLPLWSGISQIEQDKVIKEIFNFFDLRLKKN